MWVFLDFGVEGVGGKWGVEVQLEFLLARISWMVKDLGGWRINTMHVFYLYHSRLFTLHVSVYAL